MNAPTNGNKNAILDLDDLLDSNLDTVADIPDYVTPPDGLYKLDIVDAEIKKAKEAGKASRITITYKVAETVDTAGAPVADGSLFTEGFQGTEQGLEFFKKQVKKIMNVTEIGGVSMRDILEGLKDIQGMEAHISTRKTVDAVTKKEYENTNIRPIHRSA